MPPIAILDGAMGTELIRRGVPTPAPQWSAQALDTAPETIREIHSAYAQSGATVHTANTFRTDPWSLRSVSALSSRWQELTQLAVGIARSAVPAGHQVAGSLSPLEDCYRPDLVPAEALCRREHQRFAEALAAAGADLILCETFTHRREALIAVECALSTGLPVWLSLCRGPTEEILSPAAILETAAEAVDLGASAILVNCSPLSVGADLLKEMTDLDSHIGCYANVGAPDPKKGWISQGESSAVAYAQAAATWIALGADIVGGCCGTGPDHIKAVAQLIGSD